jgi:hypothetical protein
MGRSPTALERFADMGIRFVLSATNTFNKDIDAALARISLWRELY